MKNYPIGVGSGYSDMAPVLGKLRAGGDLESVGRGHVREDHGARLCLAKG